MHNLKPRKSEPVRGHPYALRYTLKSTKHTHSYFTLANFASRRSKTKLYKVGSSNVEQFLIRHREGLWLHAATKIRQTSNGTKGAYNFVHVNNSARFIHIQNITSQVFFHRDSRELEPKRKTSFTLQEQCLYN